jgi:hypothetical protein
MRDIPTDLEFKKTRAANRTTQSVAQENFAKRDNFSQKGDRGDEIVGKLFKNFAQFSDANRSQTLVSCYSSYELRHWLLRAVKLDQLE